jgi:hypothetical protein
MAVKVAVPSEFTWTSLTGHDPPAREAPGSSWAVDSLTAPVSLLVPRWPANEQRHMVRGQLADRRVRHRQRHLDAAVRCPAFVLS